LRLLLDTHAFLWFVGEREKLASIAFQTISNPENEVFLSAAVAWEIAIKYARGKLTLPLDPAAYVLTRMLSTGIGALPITHEHALATAKLPPIHGDPFDRIMIAQAQVESLIFVTRDANNLRYQVQTLLA
jgi:PIN domain nuclease of toxin-antitoxin system